MRERIVRGALLVGVIALALLFLLAALGGGGGKSVKDEGGDRKPAPSSRPSAPQLPVPAEYDTERGWDIPGGSPNYAVAENSQRVAYLARVGHNRFQLRTVEPATGKAGWTGTDRGSLFPPGRYPQLLTVTKGGREYFVVWSYGKIYPGSSQPSDPVVFLDIYDATDGAMDRTEVPWPDAPHVSTSGPGVVISDGRATSTVVDPVTGEVAGIPPGSLGYPRGCANCRKLTEVTGTTDKGLLVRGAKEFWVRGGWYSRRVAPKNTDPASGVPASLTNRYLLAKWQKKKSARDARTHEVWALHDTATGRSVLQARCRKPAITPADDPALTTSPDGNYLIAGRLAFDLANKRAYCFEEEDGTHPLTLATVANDGMAYGATGARNAADALAGGGRPIAVDLTTATPETLAPNVRLPSQETLGSGVSGVGLFLWTDGKDNQHLTGYPRWVT